MNYKKFFLSAFVALHTSFCYAQASKPNLYYGNLSEAANQDVVATIDYLEAKIRAFNDARITQRLNALTKGIPLSHALPLYATPEDKHTQAQIDKGQYSLAVNEKWLYWLNQDGRDFWLCHELMHILLNHLPERSAKPLTAQLENEYLLFCNKQEKEADLYAMRILGSARGALEFIRFIVGQNTDLELIPHDTSLAHLSLRDRCAYFMEFDQNS